MRIDRRAVPVVAGALAAAVAMGVAVATVGAAPRLAGLVERGGGGGGVVADGPGAAAPAPVVRWAAPVAGWPSALAADREGAVVLAGGGEVRALDRDGGTSWRVDLPGAELHPPALTTRTVLVGAGDRVVALDRADGTTRWEVAVADGTAGPVALADPAALYATEAGALVVLDAATGAPRWSVVHAGAVRSAPVPVAGADDDDRDRNEATSGVVVAAWHGGDDSRLRAFDLTTGASRWDAPLAPSAGGPAVHQGLALVGEGDGSGNARVVARHLADGTTAWATPVPASFESGTVPGAAGDDVAVVDHFGGLTIADVRTGAVRHEVQLGAPVLHTTVVLTPAAVALTTYGGELVVVDRRSGQVRHRGDPGGFPVALARSGPDLLVALRLTDPGRVEALDASPNHQ